MRILKTVLGDGSARSMGGNSLSSDTACAQQVAVLGAGAWGTAIGIVLASEDTPVRLYARRADHAAAMQHAGENTERLPGRRFPAGLEVTASLEQAVSKAGVVFLTGPSGATVALAREAARHARPGAAAVICAKGLAAGGELLTDALARVWTRGPVLVLSGPSFADEVAAGNHTIVSLSGPLDAAEDIAATCSRDSFVLAPCRDYRGAQLAGVFKNVAAILCGASDGLAAGSNTRAALLSEAIREASNIIIASGGNQATLLGPAGCGDFALTCTDGQSRNYRLGHDLATGKGESGGVTHEGAANAEALLRLAEKVDVEAPLVQAVVDLLHGRVTPRHAVEAAFVQRFAKATNSRLAA